ncbi:MerR family transcriptional regulator [Gordonia sp. TBRC 11910]|uniref:MerR family transcriptional regulator n=1 Tax=Gordonia asplenii TaxID=2725283 RepID=A0A848L774_9ACTN|nr:MerR family transcriptional regulator [Gordonia asplenii]NMO04361.1 MerR family transcriptional regulator [Gordonia asplenii]
MTPEHLTIGTFARLCGLTPSALRFYDDARVLAPADVDDSSGYRYYLPDQVPTAVLLRQLREAGMSLGDIRAILDDPASTTRRIDRHLADLTQRLADATAAAERVRGSVERHVPPCGGLSVPGPLFAASCDQVLPATVANPELPVLDSVLVEADGNTLTLTATDRFRLTSRTLQSRSVGADFAAVVAAAAARTLADWSRRQHRITLSRNGTDVIVTGDSDVRRVPIVDATFPDYRLMLRSLPTPTTRAVVSRDALLHLLERSPRTIRMVVSSDTLSVDDDAIAATLTGPPITVGFDVTVLYPTVCNAIGDDVMLDFSANDQPLQVRSADAGDLITLAMPIRLPD